MMGELLYLEVADGQARVLLGHLLDEGGQVGVGVRAQDEDLKYGSGKLSTFTCAS